MRLLCYALLLLAVIFATTGEATSAIKSLDQHKVPEFTASDIDVLNRAIAAGEGDNRQLRGAAETENANLSADDEERGLLSKIPLPASVSKLIAKWSAKIATWKEGMYTRAFNHLSKRNVSPEMLAERLRIGSMNTESRLVKFFEKYKTWYEANRMAIVPVK
ncbi:hypothetical protein PHYBOEH_001831 [Phytophthora boehmeriae]|uniref:RxLR effector protein n=1 Tax=Phytophthora boehmeriae TaxID=109152 RepID=A0A8T1WTA8_9STRA|nr:hypothetical protein PHYBOEH_001831 [Phytophthora boehmeriae]